MVGRLPSTPSRVGSAQLSCNVVDFQWDIRTPAQWRLEWMNEGFPLSMVTATARVAVLSFVHSTRMVRLAPDVRPSDEQRAMEPLLYGGAVLPNTDPPSRIRKISSGGLRTD